MKPIIFTEYCFASIDVTTNNPNFYYETNNEDTPKVNNHAQALAIYDSEMFFVESNSRNKNS